MTESLKNFYERKGILPAVLQGWHHEARYYLVAEEEGRLLKLVIDFGSACNLSCPGCFTVQNEDDVNKDRKHRRDSDMSLDDYKALVDEASLLGVETIDIVGAGEPTIAAGFYEFLDYALSKNIHVVLFTHGATKFCQDKKILAKYKHEPLSVFIKLWSLDQKKMNSYVRGSYPNYATLRDRAIQNLIEAGYTEGGEVVIDGIRRRMTRVGADILVMKDNLDEMPEIFQFCRERNIMPLIKNGIPQGPTAQIQERNYFGRLSSEEKQGLLANFVPPVEMYELRKRIVQLDQSMYGIGAMGTVYIQGVSCTQDSGVIYVTGKDGEINPCVGDNKYCGTYRPGCGALQSAYAKARSGRPRGIGCQPRLNQARDTGEQIPKEEVSILTGKAYLGDNNFKD